ncbi:MAG TPA: diacylglycerol kinase family protein [Ferruginibacter sp.]|nr:diacylglycerol kinase family protein [Ferruginibacter sp.]HMP19914.1 diacylglycerol kinase family protein [Ferruginibacter sp.]
MQLFKSFGYALRGIRYGFATQANLRIHLLATVLVTGAGFGLAISAAEWLVVVLCCTAVISLELLNTALEKLCDSFTTALHPGVKIIKDAAAGAVLVAAAGSAVCGCIIFVPKILNVLS